MASAKSISANQQLLIAEYEYDHAEAMGEAFGVSEACNFDTSHREPLSRLHVLTGTFATEPARRGLLPSSVVRRALAKWSLGESRTMALHCDGALVDRAGAAVHRAVRDVIEEKKIIDADQ